MSAEIYFAHSENGSALTLQQLVGELVRAGLAPRVTEDKQDQLWIEFEGLKSRLSAMKEETLGLVTLEVCGDLEAGMALAEKIEALLLPHGYFSAEQ